MSDQAEKKPKREYRKGNPLPKAELNRRYEASKARSHKFIRVLAPIDLVEDFKELCAKEGIPMQEGIALAMIDYLENVTKKSK